MGTKEASRRQDSVTLHALALQTLSAEELALRAQQGCKDSFAELVERYGMRLYQFLHNKTDNIQDTEDLVQDTFVKAYRNIHRYSTSWTFSTWLFTIAARLANSHYRSLHQRQAAPRLAPDGDCPANAVVQQETQEGLWAIARTLSADQHRALWLRYAEELPIKEIAKVLGKTQVSVKVTLYRARVNLAGRLKDMAAEDLLPVNASQNERLPIMKAEGA